MCSMKCAVFRNISSVADKAMFTLGNVLEYLPRSVDCHLFWCWQNEYLKAIHKTALNFQVDVQSIKSQKSKALTLQDILPASKAG